MMLRVAAAVLAVLIASGGFLLIRYRQAVVETERAWAETGGTALVARRQFDPAMVADLPEVAQRYFRHAIAPGTPLSTTAELHLEGRFLLGDTNSSQTYTMTARQLLAPPDAFVWVPVLRSGLLTITGSDGLLGGRAWTRFWIASLLPVADVPTSADLVPSAQFRAAMEAIWVPAALLPRPGISWTAIGPDTAAVAIELAGGPIVIELSVNAAGGLTEVVGMRWSDANPQRSFRLQPFGGTMAQETTFGGYTIPSVVIVGNMFGTDDYFPFYQARVIDIVYR